MNVQQTRARMVPLAKTESALSIVNVSKTMTESCVNQVIVCSPKGSYSMKTVLLHCSVADPGFLKRRVPTSGEGDGVECTNLLLGKFLPKTSRK